MCPASKVETKNSEQTWPRTSITVPGWRRSDTSDDEPEFTLLYTKRLRPNRDNECEDDAKSSRRGSRTGGMEPERLRPNTADEKAEQATCLANGGEPKYAESDTKVDASGRQAPSHKKAKPGHAVDREDRRKPIVRRSKDGSTGPERAQLKHGTGRPD